MASDKLKYCLVCSEIVSTPNPIQLDKFEVLFLLKVVLDIPQDSQLIYQIQSSLFSIPVCGPCGSTVKQCKQIYTQITSQIKKFWGCQSELLRDINKSADRHHPKPNQYQNWVYLCRQFVKSQNVEAFKYPFVVHDLTKLQTKVPGPASLEDPLASENRDDNEYESSEEDDSPPEIQFYWNTATSQFHYSVPSCTEATKIKMFVERHFREEHLRALANKSKISYPCSMTSCGKIFKIKINEDNQLNSFENVPSSSKGNRAEINDPFIAERDNTVLKEEPQFEDENDDDNFTEETGDDKDDNMLDEDDRLSLHGDSSNGSSTINPSKVDESCAGSTSDKPGVITDYACNWPGCGKRLSDKISYTCHMDRHRGTPKQKCEKCGQLFYSRSDLSQHHKNEHQKRDASKLVSDEQLNDLDNYKIVLSPEEQSSEDEDNSPNSKNAAASTSKQTGNCDKKLNHSKSNFWAKYPQYKFVRNTTTGKFHCLDATCSTKSRDDWYIKQHFKSHHLNIKTKRSVSCSWPGCGRIFSCETHLKYHMDEHKGTPQWKCDKCSDKFYRNSELIQHKKTTHALVYVRQKSIAQKFSLNPLTGKYDCPDKSCSKSYKHIRNIKDHFSEDHLKTKEKRGFVCEYDECSGRLFRCKSKWQAHMDKHTEMQQFESNSNPIQKETQSLEDPLDVSEFVTRSLGNVERSQVFKTETETNQGHSSGNAGVEYDFRQDPLSCLDYLERSHDLT